MNKKQYSLIIFDWDGTLYDSFHSSMSYLKQAVIDLKWPMFDEAEYAALSGLSMTHIIDSLYTDTPKEGRDLLKIRYRFHSLLHQNKVVLYPDAKSLLETLKQQGYLLAIATGKSAEGLARDLSVLRMSTWFDITRTADQTFPKPHPMIVEQILDVLNVPPQKALLVGDGILDMQTAMNANIDAVGIYRDPVHKPSLLAHGAMAAISSLTELLGFLSLST